MILHVFKTEINPEMNDYIKDKEHKHWKLQLETFNQDKGIIRQYRKTTYKSSSKFFKILFINLDYDHGYVLFKRKDKKQFGDQEKHNKTQEYVAAG